MSDGYTTLGDVKKHLAVIIIWGECPRASLTTSELTQVLGELSLGRVVILFFGKVYLFFFQTTRYPKVKTLSHYKMSYYIGLESGPIVFTTFYSLVYPHIHNIAL